MARPHMEFMNLEARLRVRLSSQLPSATAHRWRKPAVSMCLIASQIHDDGDDAPR